MQSKTTKSGFSLVEIVAVVVLLAILAAGSIAGLRVQRDNANLRQVTQALSAIDQGKQNWRLFHPSDAWPSDEPGRWLLVQGALNTSATGTPYPPGGTYAGYNSYSKVMSSNYYILIGDEGSPSSAIYYDGTATTAVVRPLN